MICTFGGNSTNDCMPNGPGERARLSHALLARSRGRKFDKKCAPFANSPSTTRQPRGAAGIAPDLLGCFSVFCSAHCWLVPGSAKSSSKQVLLSGVRRLDPLGESHRGLTSPRDDLRGFRVAVELYETHLQQFLKALCRVSRQLLPRNGEVLFHVIYDIFER